MFQMDPERYACSVTTKRDRQKCWDGQYYNHGSWGSMVGNARWEEQTTFLINNPILHVPTFLPDDKVANYDMTIVLCHLLPIFVLLYFALSIVLLYFSLSTVFGGGVLLYPYKFSELHLSIYQIFLLLRQDSQHYTLCQDLSAVLSATIV